MNSQQALNKTAAMVRAQGEPSMNGESCVYRNDDGYGCAIGVWLSDEIIGQLEEHDLINLTYSNITSYTEDSHPFTKPAKAIIKTLDLSDKSESQQNSFWSDLQSVHDSAACKRRFNQGKWSVKEYHGQEFIDRFNENLRNFAKRFGLEYPVEGYEVQEIILEQITLEGSNDE